MPKYNELKHFNAQKVVNAFLHDINGGQKTMNGGTNTLTFY